MPVERQANMPIQPAFLTHQGPFRQRIALPSFAYQGPPAVVIGKASAQTPELLSPEIVLPRCIGHREKMCDTLLRQVFLPEVLSPEIYLATSYRAYREDMRHFVAANSTVRGFNNTCFKALNFSKLQFLLMLTCGFWLFFCVCMYKSVVDVCVCVCKCMCGFC